MSKPKLGHLPAPITSPSAGCREAAPVFAPNVLLLACLVALAGLAASPQVRAQAASAPPVAAAPALLVALPAQPLAQTLGALSRQFGLSIGGEGSLLEGRTAPAIRGQLTLQQALTQALAGSGLAFVRSGDAAITVVRPGADASLPAVTVTADTEQAGPPPAYAGGQVATGSRVGLLGNKDFMETPFNTISYTDTHVQNVQAQEISRVIALTDPSVFTNGSTGMIMDSFSLRGFSVSNSDVAFGGLYGLIPYYRATPELAERVEVLKGPSALLNGMPPGGSVGGSINLVPKRAGDEPLYRVTGTYASDALFGVHVDAGQRFGADRQWGIRFNGVYRDGDGAVDHQSKQARLAALGLDWRSERVRLSADLYTNTDHVDGLNRGVSLAAGLPVPRPPSPETLLAPEGTFSHTRDDVIALRGEVDITRDVTAYASLGHGKTDFDALASSTYTVFNAAGDYRNNFAHQRAVYDKDTAEAGVRARFHTGAVKHELALTGTYYHHDYYFGFKRNMLARDWVTNIYDPVWTGLYLDRSYSGVALPKTGEVRTTSVGVADTLSFWQDRVQLTLGLRHQKVVSDTLNETTGLRTARYAASANTPAAALLFKATDRLSVYGNYIEGLSQGATAPATAENAGDVFPPYKTKQQEIGLKLDLGEFAATLSAFQIERPSSYTDPTTNVFSFGGEQRNRGLEFGFFGEPLRGLRLMGGIAYTQAKLTKTQGGTNQGRYATGLPKWQGKLGVEWDVPAVQGLALNGNMVATSRQYINADNSLWVAGRTVYDVGARYATTVASRPVTVRATVQNVTNKAYWATTLTSGLGAPRTFVLSASMDF